MPSIAVTFGGKQMILPDPAAFPLVDRKAFSYFNPLGSRPGGGWVLLTRKDLDDLDINAEHKLVIDTDGTTIDCPTMRIDHATSLFGRSSDSDTADPTSVYLVRFVDRRHILTHLSVSPTTGTSLLNGRQYNIRNPTPGAVWTTSTAADKVTLYIESTTDTSASPSVPWTWETACTDIWDAIVPAHLNSQAWPGFPAGRAFDSDDVPQNFNFVGVPMWLMLETMLEHIGLAVQYDPQEDQFAIVEMKTATLSDTFNTAQESAPVLYNAHTMRSDATNIPAELHVRFRRMAELAGTETDTQNTEPTNAQYQNWLKSTTRDSKAHTTDVENVVDDTAAQMWTTYPAVAQYDGTGAAINSTQMATIADARGAEWLAVTQNGLNRAHKIYSGVVGILPESLCKAVWWHCFSAGEGFRTEYVNKLGRVDTPEQFSALGGDTVSNTAEHFRPPEVSRATTPDYPQRDQLVTILGPAAHTIAAEEWYQPNSDGYFEGKIVRYSARDIPNNNQLDDANAEVVFVVLINDVGFNAATPNTRSLIPGQTFKARLSGYDTSTPTGGSAETRPVYVLSTFEPEVEFQLTAQLLGGTSVAAKRVYQTDGTPLATTADSVKLVATEHLGESGDRVRAVFDAVNDNWRMTASDKHGRVQWGKVKADADLDGPAADATCVTVDVNPCDNCAGDNPDAAITHTVSIPLTHRTNIQLEANQVIGYHVTKVGDGTYTIVSPAASTWIIRFNLDGALSGGSATATVDDYFGAGNPGATVTVVDACGFYTDAVTDDPGFAVWNGPSNQWQILDMRPFCAASAITKRVVVGVNFGASTITQADIVTNAYGQICSIDDV